MPVSFSSKRWKSVEKNSRLWWKGELDRPLIQVTMPGRTPDRQPPRMAVPVNKQNIYDFNTPPEDIVDRWDWDVSSQEWLGDAFPCVWLDFGPGVLAAFLGAQADPRPNTVWFHPAAPVELKDLHFSYDPEHALARRIKDICLTSVERWKGSVQVGMTDLGGNLDILSTFRPSEQLIFDLYDHPEEVKRLTWEAHTAWMDAFEDIDSILAQANPGHTAWTPIFSKEPYYMLQCDFCYMLGPDMFAEFVRPEIEAMCRRIRHPFYHLDGVGQLPHLDSLLSIPELKGIQWVPGDGKPKPDKWPEVYAKILGAGKLAQIWRPHELRAIHEAVGAAKGLVVTWHPKREDRPLVDETLAKYGA